MDGSCLGLLKRSHLSNDGGEGGMNGRGALLPEKIRLKFGRLKFLVNGVQVFLCLLLLVFNGSDTFTQYSH